jgi:hypothetical protein
VPCGKTRGRTPGVSGSFGINLNGEQRKISKRVFKEIMSVMPSSDAYL